MLTNGAVVARLHRRGAGLREPLHQADIGAPPPWRGFTVPLPGWRGSDSGLPWINLRRLPSVAPGRALAVRWERWVPVSVFRLVSRGSAILFENLYLTGAPLRN